MRVISFRVSVQVLTVRPGAGPRPSGIAAGVLR
jgi:hypothetical protein